MDQQTTIVANTFLKVVMMVILLYFAVLKRNWLAVTIALTYAFTLLGTYVFHAPQTLIMSVGTVTAALITWYVVQDLRKKQPVQIVPRKTKE